MENKTVTERPKIVAGILVYNNNDEIFLAKNVKWDDKWTVIGGHLEMGESLQDCAKREVKEETNLEIEDIRLVDIQESIFPNTYYKNKHMIFVDFSAKMSGGDAKLNDEFSEYKWFKPEDALQLDLSTSTKSFIENFLNKNPVGHSLNL